MCLFFSLAAVLFYITSYLNLFFVVAFDRVTREFYLSTEEFIDAVAQQLRGKIQLPTTV
jgi:hypothetical protein